jgi:hypothetical protein
LTSELDVLGLGSAASEKLIIFEIEHEHDRICHRRFKTGGEFENVGFRQGCKKRRRRVVFRPIEMR